MNDGMNDGMTERMNEGRRRTPQGALQKALHMLSAIICSYTYIQCFAPEPAKLLIHCQPDCDVGVNRLLCSLGPSLGLLTFD